MEAKQSISYSPRIDDEAMQNGYYKRRAPTVGGNMTHGAWSRDLAGATPFIYLLEFTSSAFRLLPYHPSFTPPLYEIMTAYYPSSSSRRHHHHGSGSGGIYDDAYPSNTQYYSTSGSHHGHGHSQPGVVYVPTHSSGHRHGRSHHGTAQVLSTGGAQVIMVSPRPHLASTRHNE